MDKEQVKEVAVKILKEVIDAIEFEDIDKLNKMIELSPAGDGYGEDNYFINFNYNDDVQLSSVFFDNKWDIADIIGCLQ